MPRVIVLPDGDRVTLQETPITGDVTITEAGASTIPTGTITVDMLATALKAEIFPVCIIGQGKIGYCTIG